MSFLKKFGREHKSINPGILCWGGPGRLDFLLKSKIHILQNKEKEGSENTSKEISILFLKCAQSLPKKSGDPSGFIFFKPTVICIFSGHEQYFSGTLA